MWTLYSESEWLRARLCNLKHFLDTTDTGRRPRSHLGVARRQGPGHVEAGCADALPIEMRRAVAEQERCHRRDIVGRALRANVPGIHARGGLRPQRIHPYAVFL